MVCQQEEGTQRVSAMGREDFYRYFEKEGWKIKRE